jgi:hypothetical protein
MLNFSSSWLFRPLRFQRRKEQKSSTSPIPIKAVSLFKDEEEL